MKEIKLLLLEIKIVSLNQNISLVAAKPNKIYRYTIKEIHELFVSLF